MIKLCGALLIIAGTTCYGLFLAFQKKSRLVRLKTFKETLLLLGGELRFAKNPMPQALLHIADKSSYTYLSAFYRFVSENLTKHTYSGFWETWAVGIDDYIRDIYLTEADCDILKNAGNMPLYLDVKMQLSLLDETVYELEKLITETEKDIREKCKIYRSAGLIFGLLIVLILI